MGSLSDAVQPVKGREPPSTSTPSEPAAVSDPVPLAVSVPPWLVSPPRSCGFCLMNSGTVLREIDALFSDSDVPLGPPQLDENDPGERRERMRRYLASLNLDNPLDHAKLMGVYSDLLQEIARRKSQYGFDAAAYRDCWIQTLKAPGFEVDPWSYGVSDPTRPTTFGLTTDALTSLTDRSAILDHLTRLGDTVETDPRLAVSTAKALIESTAKSVPDPRAG